MTERKVDRMLRLAKHEPDSRRESRCSVCVMSARDVVGIGVYAGWAIVDLARAFYQFNHTKRDHGYFVRRIARSGPSMAILVAVAMCFSACERRGRDPSGPFFPVYPCVVCEDGKQYCSDLPKHC